jgi:hypothetical protein
LGRSDAERLQLLEVVPACAELPVTDRDERFLEEAGKLKMEFGVGNAPWPAATETSDDPDS